MKNNIKNINVEALVQRCLNGERKAYRDLYNQYSQAMYHVIVRIVGQRSEAEDLLQESFIKVFKQLNHFKSRSSLGAWIKKICINTSLTQLKKKQRFEIVELNSNENFQEEQNEAIDYDAKTIHECIKKLPTGSRIVVSLYLLEGYRHSEIAEILEITESTSKSQYNRGKKLLRKALKSVLYEQG